ncbi:MAG: CBS domain-containing protein [Gemmatimonadales bacterium]
MATVAEILRRKGEQVHAVSPSDSVLAAVQIMNEARIGGVVVLSDQGELVGMFTERDLMRRVVGKGLQADHLPIGNVMTTEVIGCGPDASLEECAAAMTRNRVRHLPVLDGQRVVGIVTIGDLLAYQVNDQRETIEQLTSFVYENR